MEMISPGLTRKTNPQTNKVEQLPICNTLLRRFYDETLVKKDRLKILPRKRGNLNYFLIKGLQPATIYTRGKKSFVFLSGFCQISIIYVPFTFEDSI